MKSVIHKLLGAGLVLAVVATLTTPLRAQDDAAALYKAKCVSCHGADGSGNTPVGTKLGVKSVSDPELAKKSDAEWIDATKKGKGKMPSYEGKLTDDQIKSLVKYMRSLAK
ncbi:MAG TPA: cytochrome c [Candidatus Angelobacter sp.]|nr:cytochrome c [Candidatus Angelobacter sp.]